MLSNLAANARCFPYSFCVTNINAILTANTGIAILNVVYDNTGSPAAAIILGTLLMTLTFFATVTVIAAASRQCWAFARDGGFPFSRWIMKVRKGIPLNAFARLSWRFTRLGGDQLRLGRRIERHNFCVKRGTDILLYHERGLYPP